VHQCHYTVICDVTSTDSALEGGARLRAGTAPRDRLYCQLPPMSFYLCLPALCSCPCCYDVRLRNVYVRLDGRSRTARLNIAYEQPDCHDCWSSPQTLIYLRRQPINYVHFREYNRFVSYKPRIGLLNVSMAHFVNVCTAVTYCDSANVCYREISPR